MLNVASLPCGISYLGDDLGGGEGADACIWVRVVPDVLTRAVIWGMSCLICWVRARMSRALCLAMRARTPTARARTRITRPGASVVGRLG